MAKHRLPLVVAFAVGISCMTVIWQLRAQFRGCPQPLQKRSALHSIGAWQDRERDGTIKSEGTPSDAALAVCLAVKNQHDDIKEVRDCDLAPLPYPPYAFYKYIII